MVRFTLKHAMTSACIKMDIPENESLQELIYTVKDYWEKEDMMFIRGYDMLDERKTIGESLREGDVVEAIYDLRNVRADSLMGRILYSARDGGIWPEDSELKRTS